MTGTYSASGSVNPIPYSFIRLTTSGTETLPNAGRGNPVYGGTGFIRSFFRPSDDATIF
jgi:meiotically up-regulated gene 157 (Mug157) protein